MKKSAYRLIRFGTPILCLLLLLPSFCLWAVAETQSTENGISQQALESAEALDLQRAELVSELDGESLIFNYVDRASFIEAGHVERVCEDEEPNTYVFKNADGSKTVYFLDEDVKYVNAGGEATEKKLDLVALDGGYTTRASNVSLALPNAIASGVTLAYNGNSVTLTPKPQSLTGGTVSAGSALAGTAGASMTAALEAALVEQALQIAPVGIASGKADYQGVFGTGTTLRYTPTLSGVKEDVILDAYRGQNTFAFTLNTGNLSVFEEEGRYFIAPTADAEEKILISDTWVYDAAGNFEKGTLSVVQVKNGLYLLTVGASVEFLTDENTVYPVYIDPTLTVDSGTDYIEDAGIYQGDPTGNYGSANYFDVGTYSSTLGVGRAVVRLNGLFSSSVYANINSVFIDEVEFCIYHRTISEGTVLNVHPLINESWSAGEVTWNTVGAYGDRIAQVTTSAQETMESIDITSLVRDWKIENAWYPARPNAGFILISSNETARNRFYSADITNEDFRPYVCWTYHSGVEILSPEQPYRIVGDNEKIYVTPGESIQLEAARFSNRTQDSWTSSNQSVAAINSTAGILTPMSTGCTTVTVTRVEPGETEMLTYTDSVEVWVVPIVPGEYYIESPLLNNPFIEPLTDGAVGDYFTIGELSDNEDNSFIVEFIHNGDFGYYTFKKEYTDSEGTVSERYLGFSSASAGNKLRFYNNCSTNTKWFDIEKCLSGYYKITPQVSAQWGRVLSSDANPVTGEHLTIQSYTLDSGFEDEWIFRRVLPRSGSERNIDSEIWDNAHIGLNCFSYAFNCLTGVDGTSQFTGLVASNEMYQQSGVTIPIDSDDVYKLLRLNADLYGFKVERIEKYELCPEGYYKVAIVAEDVNSLGAFHCYRQTSNGLWAHRKNRKFLYDSVMVGSGEISREDASGKCIFAPDESNRNFETDQGLEYLEDYPYFVGYFAVDPHNVFQP